MTKLRRFSKRAIVSENVNPRMIANIERANTGKDIQMSDRDIVGDRTLSRIDDAKSEPNALSYLVAKKPAIADPRNR